MDQNNDTFICDLRDPQICVYEITADYRPKNRYLHPKYYEFAHSNKEAKKKYLSRMPWMNVYKIEKVTDMDRIRDIFALKHARSKWYPGSEE